MSNQSFGEVITSNPLITLDMEADALHLELWRIQPRLHKRLTERLKRCQEAYIIGETAKVFGVQQRVVRMHKVDTMWCATCGKEFLDEDNSCNCPVCGNEGTSEMPESDYSVYEKENLF